MYGMNFSGGKNKSHVQIEQTDRIDSFEASRVEGWGIVHASRIGETLSLHCEHYDGFDFGPELVELSYPGSRWRDTLELTRVRSGFGGDRAFWCCPRCGNRSRFLYFKKAGFVCRTCAGLNYKVQQRTKNSINHFCDGLKLAREKLGWEPPNWVVPVDFPYISPPRPQNMHMTTYLRHLARYRRYQEKYQRESMREMMAILRK